ncbi:hypothetical protein [Deinococcus sp.]|uniref:hypothetical protein n=1 Tax=Deinococcus sp. TaxID=47478 RepID=UPI003C7C3370
MTEGRGGRKTAFEELDNYLTDRPFSDSWSDDGIIQAELILHEFRADDWIAIIQALPGRNDPWKLLLADALNSSTSQHSIDVFMLLMHTQNPEVFFYVGNSLESSIDLGLTLSQAQILELQSLIAAMKEAQNTELLGVGLLELELAAYSSKTRTEKDTP